MNNKERKLFNISVKIEKLLYEYCSISIFNKEVPWNSIIINTGRKSLNWDFIENLTNLTKKENINFSINIEEEVLKIKIWL